MNRVNRDRIRNGIADIFWVCYQRCKLFARDRVILAVIGISIAASVWLILSLSVASREQSALPIGVVDDGQSNASRQLVKNLKKVNTLNIIEEKEEKLKKLLLDQRIIALFVIKEGYEDKLIRGDASDSIAMYYAKDNKSASVISDIVAGEMMYSVCYDKGLCLYHQVLFHGQKHSQSQYKEHMEKLLKSKDFDFAFRIRLDNGGRSFPKQKTISNAILYNQLMIGILGIFLAYIAMFLMSGAVYDKETGVAERLKVVGVTGRTLDMANFMVLALIGGIIALLFTGLMMTHLHLKALGLWKSVYLLFLLYILVQGGIFLLLSKWMKTMMAYQLAGSICILVTGGLGFFALLSGLVAAPLQYFEKIIPNSWLIAGFTDIMVYGSKDGYSKVEHRIQMIAIVIALTALITFATSAGLAAAGKKNTK
jgi:ABC-2 type transport system permease protein